ncbi:NAD(P)-binding protein [candidate division WWE3 bacterium]|nr:NAD(P)-binding protein [candidate division WWE3 bacterium]
MRIGIIGAGFTGLAAAIEAQKNGHSVIIFEQNNYVGGLAAGMRGRVENYPTEWEWDLEQYYHHWFTNDEHVYALAEGIGVKHKIIIKNPVSSILYKDQIYPFDSPFNLLRFPHFNPIEKARVSFLLGKLKYLENETTSAKFEAVTAHEYIPQIIGQRPYEVLFEPLLKGKFGQHYQKITMRWFWARIYKRTSQLAYYQGGFSAFAQDLANYIERHNGKIHVSTAIKNIAYNPDKTLTITIDHCVETVDRVIVTTPPAVLPKLMPSLPTEYLDSLTKDPSLAAYVVVLSLHHPLMDKTYWLNINQENWPFLAAVEHTNFIDKKYYNNEHILYIGNYVEPNHPHMHMDVKDLVKEFTPFIKRINPLFSSESIRRMYLLRTIHAQPIVTKEFAKQIIPIDTPIPELKLATMSQVYPWDRGTNYAIEIGQKAVRSII